MYGMVLDQGELKWSDELNTLSVTAFLNFLKFPSDDTDMVCY